MTKPRILRNDILRYSSLFSGSKMHPNFPKDFLIMWLQPACYLNCLAIPVVIALLLYNRPWQPPFFGSFLFSLYPNQENRTLYACSLYNVSRFLILLLEYVIFSQTVLSASFHIIYVVVAGICSISKYTGALSYRPGPRENGISEYRILHVATNYVNDCIKHTLFPACIVEPPLLQMLGTFACIKLRNEIDWPLFGLFPLIVCISFILTVMPLLAAGNVFVTTCQVLERWRSHVGEENGYWRRIVKSMRPLRIYFGGNFVDASTPLVVQDFCMRQIASLLMYSNSHRM